MAERNMFTIFPWTRKSFPSCSNPLAATTILRLGELWWLQS